MTQFVDQIKVGFLSQLIKYMMFSYNCCDTLLVYTLASKHLDSLHCLPGSYWFCWCSQWMTQNFYLFCLHSSCDNCSCLSNCYSSLHKYAHISIVTETWIQYCGLQFDLAIYFLCSTYIIIMFHNPVFFLEFWRLTVSVAQQIHDLLILISLTICL